MNGAELSWCTANQVMAFPAPRPRGSRRVVSASGNVRLHDAATLRRWSSVFAKLFLRRRLLDQLHRFDKQGARVSWDTQRRLQNVTNQIHKFKIHPKSLVSDLDYSE